MTLDEARENIEVMYTLGPVGNSRFAPTGEEYVEVCSGGICEPDIPVFCRTEETAIRLWFDAMARYGYKWLGVAKPTLYWRIEPYMEECQMVGARDGTTRKFYWVYSRLLLSDKPVIAAKAA